MKQRSIVFGLVVCFHMLTAARLTLADEHEVFLGTFENEELGIVIRKAESGFEGLVKQGDQTFAFIAKIQNQKMVGSFQKDGVSYAFSARKVRDNLEVTLGLKSSLLRRKSEQSEFVGTFRGSDLSIEIKKSGKRFFGEFKQGSDAVEFLGLLDKDQLRGEFTKDDVKYLFTAALAGNTLKLTFGLQTFELERIRGKKVVGGDQTPNTVRRRVLLADGKDVVAGSVLVSPDNNRIAYISQTDENRRVVVNGQASKPYRLINLWKFSPDSKRLAYIATVGNKYIMVIDDKESEPFDGFWFGNSPFSPDSQRTAYAGVQNRKWHLVVDGKKDETVYENIAGVAFSPDSKRVVFGGQRHRKWSAIIDGEAHGSYDAIGFGRQPFSPNSQLISYAFHANDRQYLTIDGSESKAYDVVTNGMFSPNSARFAFNAVRSNQHHVIHNGVEGPAYDQIGGLTFSPNSKTIAYAARKGAKWTMVVNGKAGTLYDAVSSAFFSADGTQLAYVARLDDIMLVIRDGHVEAEFSDIRELTLSPDGKQIAFVARKKSGEWHVVVGDTISEAFKQPPSGITFSPDSQYVAYVLAVKGEWFLVVDGVVDKPVGQFLPGSELVFDGPRKLHTVVSDGDEFYRLDVEILQ